MPRSELVKYFAASSAAVSPSRAAFPGCRLLQSLPNISRRPADCVAAMPSAQLVRCASSPSRRAHAAADTEDAAGSGRVIARFGMRWIHRIADAQLDFGPEDERIEQRRSADLVEFGRGKQGGPYRGARMYRVRMGIVEVEHVRGDAVDERRIEGIAALAASGQGRLRGTEVRLQCRHGAFDRFVAAAADRATEYVDQCALGLVAHGCGNLLGARIHDETRERCGDFHELFPLCLICRSPCTDRR